jgi:hypothetical protein
MCSEISSVIRQFLTRRHGILLETFVDLTGTNHALGVKLITWQHNSSIRSNLQLKAVTRCPSVLQGRFQIHLNAVWPTELAHMILG